MNIEDVLVKPMITEKTSLISEKFNRYGFIVATKSNKFQIKKAVESLYDVKVISVRTNINPGKLKRSGKTVKKSAKIKKALVQLAEGQRIEFFKGV